MNQDPFNVDDFHMISMALGMCFSQDKKGELFTDEACRKIIDKLTLFLPMDVFASELKRLKDSNAPDKI